MAESPPALEPLRRVLERRLEDVMQRRFSGEAPLDAACREAVLSPGKRFRPLLLMLVGQLFRVPAQRTAGLGVVVELVHSASLVLDDLPSMDNAELRRGRPTIHRRFGEATAILAAFRLLSLAHALLPEALSVAGVPRARRAGRQEELAAVVEQLCLGQRLDLDAKAESVEDLERVHAAKTGALFVLAARWGGLAGRPSAGEEAAIEEYARNLGLAFQVVDDILDTTGDPEALGKPVGLDRDRVTFVDLLGVDGARRLAAELTETAIAALAPFGRRGDALADLARRCCARDR